MKAYIYIFTFMILLCPIDILISQQDTLTEEYSLTIIDTAEYNTLKKEVLYIKDKQKLLPKKFEEKKKKKSKSKKDNIATNDYSWLDSSLVKILMYGLIGALVLVVVWLLLSNIKLNNQSETIVISEIDDYIEDIEKVDTDEGLSNALAAKDYRRATRMIFLKVLQRLQVDERINWKPEKTNRHYVSEMSSDNDADAFRKIAATYEKAWYGNKPIDLDGLLAYGENARTFIDLNIRSHD